MHKGSQETLGEIGAHQSYPGRSERHRRPAFHLHTPSPEVTPPLNVQGTQAEPHLPFSATPETTGNPT